MPGTKSTTVRFGEIGCGRAAPYNDRYPVPGLVSGTHVFPAAIGPLQDVDGGQARPRGGFWLGIPNKLPAEAALARGPDSRGTTPGMTVESVSIWLDKRRRRK